jgi:hypothetical protein
MDTYERGSVETIYLAGLNFATPVPRTIRGPKGARGRIINVGVFVTTAFVGTTTAGKLRIGDGVTVNKYTDMDMGAAGAGTAAAATVRLSDNRLFDKSPDGGIAVDSAVVITPVAPVGGAPAGVGDVAVTINWY